MLETFKELKQLQAQANMLVNSGDNWEEIYDEIFPNINRPVMALFSKMGLSFDWYDPDMGYEDDVRAFVNALNSRMEELAPLKKIFAVGENNKLQELRSLYFLAKKINDSELDERDKYALVFSEELGDRVFDLCKELGRALSYYDYALSREEKIGKFVYELEDYIQNFDK